MLAASVVPVQVISVPEAFVCWHALHHHDGGVGNLTLELLDGFDFDMLSGTGSTHCCMQHYAGIGSSAAPHPVCLSGEGVRTTESLVGHCVLLLC